MIKDIQDTTINIGDKIAFATAIHRGRPYLYILEVLAIGEELSSGFIAVKVRHLHPNFKYGPNRNDISTIDGSLFSRKALVLKDES